MTRPILIGIGGAHSGSGKTTYASLLFQRLRGWGGIKYTKTELYCSLIDERDVLLTEGKDTRKMLDAGAERVLWVKSPPSELRDLLPLAMEKLSDLQGVIVEGNSAIEFLVPDIIIFIFGDNSEKLKESAKGVLGKADVVLSEEGTPGGVPGKARLFRKSLEYNEEFLTSVMRMVEKKDMVRAALNERSENSRIPCPVARAIAEELKVDYQEVGRTANELGIKIVSCELGCF
jgi:molybdopterin-guanine dinucleotide biosynthesis protein